MQDHASIHMYSIRMSFAMLYTQRHMTGRSLRSFLYNAKKLRMEKCFQCLADGGRADGGREED